MTLLGGSGNSAIVFQPAIFNIKALNFCMFGEGISKTGEIIDLGVEYGIIKKSGSWFSYGDTKLAQGRDSAKQVVKDNPELAAELEIKIMEAIKAKWNKLFTIKLKNLV